MTDLPNGKIIEETDYIHTYFGLSYSAYQVLPRTLMQSMPAEWQKRMVACLEELRAAFRHIEHADVYEVTAAVECYYDELTEADMKALGISRPDAPDGDDEDADLPNVYYDRDGVEHESHERVLVPRPGGDPIPHYNRGRTHIEPLPLPVADGVEAEPVEPCGSDVGVTSPHLCVLPKGHGGDWHDDGSACWPVLSDNSEVPND